MKKVKIKLSVLTLFFVSLFMISCGSEAEVKKEQKKDEIINDTLNNEEVPLVKDENNIKEKDEIKLEISNENLEKGKWYKFKIKESDIFYVYILVEDFTLLSTNENSKKPYNNKYATIEYNKMFHYYPSTGVSYLTLAATTYDVSYLPEYTLGFKQYMECINNGFIEDSELFDLQATKEEVTSDLLWDNQSRGAFIIDSNGEIYDPYPAGSYMINDAGLIEEF
jgi:hypothetical protein